jgi:GNAT superfamily N-acetyltransferase
MPDQPIRVRDRLDADLDLCVRALAAVYETGSYPTHWPADPARWLTPSGTIKGWVASSGELPVAGHVIVRQTPGARTGERVAEVSRLFVIPAARRQGAALALLSAAVRWATGEDLDLMLEVAEHLRAARALYERSGFQLVRRTTADWSGPDGQQVTLVRYSRTREPRAPA